MNDCVTEYFMNKLEKTRGKHRKIVIENCGQCPHMDHSGHFTPGGAYPLCSATKAPPGQRKFAMRILPWEVGPDEPTQVPTRVFSYVIPDWCPLERD